jgi:uncharacterized membrane protein YkgB
MLVGWILTLIDDGNRNFPYGLIGGILGLIIPVVLLSLIVETTPTALDVYKGKTTLEITYKDSIPIDTVVVFKNKEN